MLAHHHLDRGRIIRVLIFVWTLLLLLVLLPIRVHGQEVLETAPSLQTQLATLLFAEILFLCIVVVSYSVMRAHSREHHTKPRG